MAKYFQRVLSLDEDESLDTSFSSEQTQDVTEVIDMDTNSDEISEEAAAIEEDVEAMENGNEAVGELAEQESMNEELLDNPQEITPDIAKATNDAFKITLAGLAIDVRDTTYGNITYDSNRNEPIQVVRITQDGVKDWLDKVKEHIIAFFRAIKNKIQKLIAKLFIMFSNCSKQGEALEKQLRNKLTKLKEEKHGKIPEIDVKNHSIKSKIARYSPVLFDMFDGDCSAAVDWAGRVFGGNTTVPPGMQGIKEVIDRITTIMDQTEGKGGKSYTAKTAIDEVNKELEKKQNEEAIKYANSLDKRGDLKLEKKDYEISKPWIIAGFFSRSGKTAYFKLHEDADVLIPSIVFGQFNLTQDRVDNIDIKNVKPDDIKGFIETAIKIGKNSKGMCQGAYKHLEDIEKEIINACNKAAKDGDVSNGTFVKYSSVARSLAASCTFHSVMEQAKAGKRILGFANMLYHMLDDQVSEDKKEAKRNNKNKD